MPPLTRRQLLAASLTTASVASVLPVAVSSAAVARKKKDWQAGEFRRMVALGESTTAGGWSTNASRCWVSVLGRLVNDFQSRRMEVINNGIGSNVISTKSPCYPPSGKPAASERLQKHVLDHRPDLLVISYGLNDARGGTPLPLFQAEMAAVIRTIRRSIDPLIVLPSPYYMTDFNGGGRAWTMANLEIFHKYGRGIEAVAKKEGCLFVDLLEASGHADWIVHYDGIHQSDLGHRIVANRIFEVLATNCSGLAAHTRLIEKQAPRWRDESKLRADYGY
ncbi:MAG: SGNH/GDSL hydrolase family protein [Planctomycetaceae bacterium]